jgi:hypothetical protein
MDNDTLSNREFFLQITTFPELTPELLAELNCPDFREKRLLENIIDIFKRDKIDYDKAPSRSGQKIKSLFKKLFGAKERPPNY